MSKGMWETCRNPRSVLQESYVYVCSFIIIDMQGMGGRRYLVQLVKTFCAPRNQFTS